MCKYVPILYIGARPAFGRTLNLPLALKEAYVGKLGQAENGQVPELMAVKEKLKEPVLSPLKPCKACFQVVLSPLKPLKAYFLSGVLMLSPRFATF